MEEYVMENIVFYFSGTGNCLKVAKSIANELSNTEIVSMAKLGKYVLKKQYDTIGFIYPTYFWGLPKRTIEFISNLNLGNNKGKYYYSITTYGGKARNSINQMYELLFKKHNIKLNFATKLKMVENYIILYKMQDNINEITNKSNEGIILIINSIKQRINNKVNRFTKVFSFMNWLFRTRVSNMDKKYNVNSNCNSCGICKKVCPVKNIEITTIKPQFNHNCENCLACIQYCPQRAINYKKVTQNKGRYTNPEISYNELEKYNDM
jgi:ferredoxin